MAIESLSDLKALTEDGADIGATDSEAAAPREPKIDAHGRAYGTGRRKESVARVFIKPGSGKVTVNGKDQEEYFKRAILRLQIAQPLEACDRAGQYDIMATVTGGGLSGQAGAVRHGLARALDNFEPQLHTILRRGGFLTRDARTVERKKYGRAKARRSFQFSKR